MSKTGTITAATYTLLGLLAVVSFVIPRSLTVPSSLAGGPPEEIVLNGVLRDFSETHADFGVTTVAGHYAGTVRAWLPGTRRPLFVGDGYEVTSPWYDGEGRPIAPHLAGVRGGLSRETLGFRVDGGIELKKDTWIDAFNSNYGPYGVDGNFGQDALLTTNAIAPGAIKLDKKAFVRGDVLVGVGGTPSEVIDNSGIITGAQRAADENYEMPSLSLPEDLGGYDSELTLGGVVVLTGDTTPDDDSDEPAMHVGDLVIEAGAIVTIEGDLRIRCDRSFRMDKAEIRLAPEANIAIFVSDVGGGTGDVEIRESRINADPGDTTLVTINAIGAGKFRIEKKSHVCATVVAPERRIDVKDEAHFYGGLIAGSLKLDREAGVHVDLGNADVGPTNFALSVREKVKVDDHSTIDSFDSNDGPYGGGNRRQNAWVSTNAIEKAEKVEVRGNSVIGGDVMIGPFGDMDKVFRVDAGSTITGARGQLATPYAIPVIAPPPMTGQTGPVNNVTYNGGSHVISSDLHCKKLKLENSAHVTIDGDVTIRCDDKVELRKNSWIRLNPGATLTLYVNKELKLEDNCQINMNTGNPQVCSIRVMSLGKKGRIRLNGKSQVCAWAMGAKSELNIEDKSEFFGSFTGKKIEVRKDSWMHVDMAYLSDCVDVLDTAGTKGSVGPGAVTSAESFDEWFRTILGVNQAIGHPITLVRGADGNYEYLDDAFHPIDGSLLGDEGDAHNNNFTYTISGTFEHRACAGDFIEFAGGDGAWLFINNQLVMDLGGVRAPTGQYVELDRLGLEDGGEYRVSLFYAQRQATESVFRLRTSLEISSDRAIPNVTAMFD